MTEPSDMGPPLQSLRYAAASLNHELLLIM